MNKYGIIIPNRYPDIIAPLIESIHRFVPDPKPCIIVVANGHTNDYGFDRVDYPQEKFVFAKAVNLGIKHLSGLDVILLNDDCVLLEQDFFNKLQYLAYKYENVGVLSPLIKGCVGNASQRWWDRYRTWGLEEEFKIEHRWIVCFPCVYIKRALLDQIGPLNEAFTSYGGEDGEFCERTRRAAFDKNRTWRTAITSSIVIQHGDGSRDMQSGRGRSWSTSYAREKTAQFPQPRQR